MNATDVLDAYLDQHCKRSFQSSKSMLRGRPPRHGERNKAIRSSPKHVKASDAGSLSPFSSPARRSNDATPAIPRDTRSIQTSKQHSSKAASNPLHKTPERSASMPVAGQQQTASTPSASPTQHKEAYRRWQKAEVEHSSSLPVLPGPAHLDHASFSHPVPVLLCLPSFFFRQQETQSNWVQALVSNETVIPHNLYLKPVALPALPVTRGHSAHDITHDSSRLTSHLKPAHTYLLASATGSQLSDCAAQHLSQMHDVGSRAPGSKPEITERPRSITNLPQPSPAHPQALGPPLPSARPNAEPHPTAVTKRSSMPYETPFFQPSSSSSTADILGSFPSFKHRGSNSMGRQLSGNNSRPTATLSGSASLPDKASAAAAAAVPSFGTSNQVWPRGIIMLRPTVTQSHTVPCCAVPCCVKSRGHALLSCTTGSKGWNRKRDVCHS